MGLYLGVNSTWAQLGLAGATSSPSTPSQGPNGVEPTIAGARSITSYSGATMSVRNSSIAAGQIITLPAGVFEDVDFRTPANYPIYCMFLNNPGGIYGSGIDQTILQVKAGSLTFGGTTTAEQNNRPDPQYLKTPANIPYTLARFDRATVIKDLTFRGTVMATDPSTGVEYSYSGVTLYGIPNPTLERVKITHIPGSDGQPPNETFPLYFYQCPGKVTLRDVIIDGDHVSASGVSGQTSISDTTLEVYVQRLSISDGPYGGGWTCFNRNFKSIYFEDFKTRGSLVGANFENCVVNGGAANCAEGEGVVFVRPDFGAASGKYGFGYKHLSIEASVNGGTNGASKSVAGVSNRFDIYDPTPEGLPISASNKMQITISRTYAYPSDGSIVPAGNQAQKSTDIHLWVGGTWVNGKYQGGTERNDLIYWNRTQPV